MPEDAPVVLKLASLARNQIGPFLILGVDKDAGKEAIEAAWAQRLIAARKTQTAVPLEDINWAREIITDPERRLRADAVSMSIETSAGTLRQLRDRFQQTSSLCQPIDIEPTFTDYQPNVPAATLEEIRAQVPEPRIPREMPAVPNLLKDAVQEALDPWAFTLAKPEPPPDNRTLPYAV
jgi:hypothetical protein